VEVTVASVSLAPDTRSDEGLLAWVRRGDRHALRALYERHGAVVLAVATIAAPRTRRNAEEATAAAFVELFRAPPSIDDDAVRGFLVRAVSRSADAAVR
jgi:DNA-directed RNA polymerase specialized sigma24 family protein